MFEKLRSLFLPRKDTIPVTVDINRFAVHIFGPYFALKGISQSEVAEIINLRETQFQKTSSAFDFLWEKRFEQGNSSKGFKTIISPNCEGWIFMYWKNGIFENARAIAEKLIKVTSETVNYYYIDSQVDGYDWILAYEGKIYRALEYNMSTISTNYGEPVTELEKSFINNVELAEQGKQHEFIFGENVFESVLQKSGPSQLKYYENDSDFLIGLVHV